MKKPFTALLAVAIGLAALAEPCVLEKGYKPSAKQADNEVVSLLGELSSDTPAAPQAEPLQAAESQGAETAAGKMPAPPVTPAPTR